MNDESILKVNNLRISFKTNTGTVKAVRGINLDLKKGKTLAIVGESGSGKSVTSKAVLGISANNVIVEDGEIIYDGKDLLTLSEENFSKIRGVKISMIFQDPLSALNPIMRVGKQLTETMILETKAVKKAASKEKSRIDAKLKAVDANLLKQLSAESIDSDLANYKGFFKDAAETSNSEYLKAVESIKKLALTAKETVFAEYSEEKIKTIIPSLKQIFKELKNIYNIFANSIDNVLGVYSTMMKNYINNMKSVIKYSAHLQSVLDANNVTDVFDLPPLARCKERECVKAPTEYFEAMQKLNDKLIARCDEIAKENATVTGELVNSLVEKYCKLRRDSVLKLSEEEAKTRAVELMREVGIPNPEKRFNQYPFEFSGGMRQRIVIAIALSGNPEILICDEPTTALDVTIQAQILELINRLKKEKNLSIIFITHDLGVVANMADDIAVMYAGKVVEYGSVYDIFYDPRHPYTWALLGSMPDLNTKGKLDAIPGTPPNMLLPPKGDAFAARNNYALALDYKQEAPFFKISETHYAKTWLAHSDCIDVVPPRTVYERIENSLKENSNNTPVYDLKKNSILEFIKNKKGKKED